MALVPLRLTFAGVDAVLSAGCAPPSTSDDLRPGNLDRRMVTAGGYLAAL